MKYILFIFLFSNAWALKPENVKKLQEIDAKYDQQVQVVQDKYEAKIEANKKEEIQALKKLEQKNMDDMGGTAGLQEKMIKMGNSGSLDMAAIQAMAQNGNYAGIEKAMNKNLNKHGIKTDKSDEKALKEKYKKEREELRRQWQEELKPIKKARKEAHKPYLN